jgi:alkyl hydroperoxide reductase subunit D
MLLNEEHNMNLDALKESLGDHAKDIKLNLASVMSEAGAPELSLKQIHGIALACAYSTKQAAVITALTSELLSDAERQAAKSAATIMAMNNIYYRFCHMVSDKSYMGMPAKLRMNVIGNPGIDKVDFELNCLAVSAINGCGMCVDAHTHELSKAGVSKLAIQSAVRIAAVVNATAMAVTV